MENRNNSFDVCFIRHGETTANRDGIMQGQCDYPLTDLGRQQASVVGDALSGVPWTFCYSSDLTRAVDTAMIVMSRSVAGQGQGLSLKQQVELREHHFGIREGLSLPTTPFLFLILSLFYYRRPTEEAIPVTNSCKDCPREEYIARSC